MTLTEFAKQKPYLVCVDSVSGANLDAVLAEWQEHGLLDYVDVVCSQNDGSKAYCIQKLLEQGFEVFIYESPLDKIKAMIARGEKPSLNLYFAGKHSIADFVEQQDMVISLFDVMNGHPTFGLSKGGGEIPWYVHELPVVGISVNKPTMLADCPMLRTYINAYDSNDDTMDALVDALVTGDFRGKDPIDSFCGMWDTRI